MAVAATPKRGEVWTVNFDPTIGAEIGKARPAVVIGLESIGRLPLKLVVPITDDQVVEIAEAISLCVGAP